jgi:hypothetical protein
MTSERSDAPVIDDLKFDEVRPILVTYGSILISALLQARFRTAQGDITLLQWLSTAEKAISVLEPVRRDACGIVCIADQSLLNPVTTPILRHLPP